MVLFIVSALIAIAALGVGIYLAYKFIKSAIPPVPFAELYKRILVVIGVFALAFVAMMFGIYLWNNIKPTSFELVATIVGGLFTGLLAPISLFTFLFHYYGKGKDIPEKVDKWLFRALVIAFPLMFVAIFFLTEGFANHCVYPLPNGLSFTQGFVTPKTGDANIAFYAICILSGAIYVYLLEDHKFYLEYGKHGILESTFLIAFPAGIIGARIFYVIGNWSLEFAGQEWWKPFAIWEGGLTILGGALTGIVFVVAWFLWRNKGYSIWIAVDIIIPTILIAQAVGRWGNFFNCEVHGTLSPISNWMWLPTFIRNNATYSVEHGFAPDGYLYVPLFFIECLTNLLGFFVIAHVFGNRLRKYTELGDLAFSYLIWYGLTRMFMEPLRDSSFNMGKNGFWSWIWSLVFVMGGSLIIALNHLIRYLRKKKDVNKNQYFIGSICVFATFVALFVPAIILMSSSKMSQTLVLNKFNWGLILLSLSISVLFGLLITLPPLLLSKKAATQETKAVESSDTVNE